MSTRPLLAATAAASALLIGGLAGAPALAATATSGTPAKGVGTSSVTLLELAAGGHSVSVGSISLVSDTAGSAALAKASITPVLADGVAFGHQEVTPSSSPVTVPSVSSPAALAGVVSVSSPEIAATATSAPSSNAGTSSLGSVSLLGLTLPLDGSAVLGTAVTSTSALGQKTVTVTDLSLPSIGAILAALGLDVTKLPAGTVSGLVNGLDLATTAMATAQAAVDTAQAQVTAATAAVTAAEADLATKADFKAAAEAAQASALITLNGLLAQVTTATTTLYPGADTVAGYATLVQAGIDAVEADAPGTAAAYAAYTDATNEVAAATAQVAAAQAAVDAAQAALATAVATLTAALGPLDTAAAPVLTSTPLVSLASLTIGTTSKSTSDTLAGQTAKITGGSVDGLEVLGNDVLQAALGSSTVDLLDLVGTQATAVTTAINGLTSTLSSVLSGVSGVTFPAPQITLLKPTTKTWVEGGYGRALATVQGLGIVLPAITIPSALALPGAVDLPALSGVTQVAGQLSSAPVSIGLLSVSDQSAFRPAVLPGTTVSTPKDQLASTGLPAGLPAIALLLVGGALIARRRRLVPVTE